MQCVTWLLLFALAVFVMMSLLRWFEQTADAVDQREWNKVALLVTVPFAAWFYRGKVGAGRPTAVPHHDPVRGFGPLPKDRPVAPAKTDQPPPGTPKEFLGMPVVPPKPNTPKRPPVDPDKLAKLKQKMREQGMLPDDDGGA